MEAGFYEVNLIEGTAQTKTCIVVFKPLQLEYIATYVYAHNTKDEKRELWGHLSEVKHRCKAPWVVMLDFNNVLKQDDIIRVNHVTYAKVVEFQECVEDCGLTEMPNFDSQYTSNDIGSKEILLQN